MTETVIKGSIRLIKHIDAELETPENMPTPQTEAEIPAAPEGSAYFVSPDAAALEDAQEPAASDDAKDAAEPAAEETPMPNQADTETPAESEPKAADTLIPSKNEAEPEPENGSVPAAEFNPSGNAALRPLYRTPDRGAGRTGLCSGLHRIHQLRRTPVLLYPEQPDHHQLHPRGKTRC